MARQTSKGMPRLRPTDDIKKNAQHLSVKQLTYAQDLQCATSPAEISFWFQVQPFPKAMHRTIFCCISPHTPRHVELHPASPTVLTWEESLDFNANLQRETLNRSQIALSLIIRCLCADLSVAREEYLGFRLKSLPTYSKLFVCSQLQGQRASLCSSTEPAITVGLFLHMAVTT